MSEVLRWRSPLSDLQSVIAQEGTSTKTDVSVRERSRLGHLNLRGNPYDQVFLDSVQSCLGLTLPLKANSASSNSTATALWLGPDEWLLVTPRAERRELVSALSETLCHRFFAVTDITDSQTIFRISGPRAVDVLRKNCSLDLHPRVFQPGCCAQTAIAKVGVLIHFVDCSPCLDLIVRRSFAEYFALWVQDAGSEYGIELIAMC